MVESHMGSCAPQGSSLCRSVPNIDNENISSPISAASVTPPPCTQQSSSASSAPVQVYWNIGKPSIRSGTVHCPACPSPGTLVNYSNIASHLTKVHLLSKELLSTGRLCPVCKRSVLPWEVGSHMPLCAPHSRTDVPEYQIKNQTQQYPTKVVLTRSLRVTQRPGRIIPNDRRFGPAFCKIAYDSDRFADSLILPGLNLVEGRSKTSGALKMALNSYLVGNYVTSPRGGVNCLWMYKNYQDAIKSLGMKEVVSRARFVVMVTELAESNWRINVKPQGIELLEDVILDRLANSDSDTELYFKYLTLKHS